MKAIFILFTFFPLLVAAQTGGFETFELFPQSSSYGDGNYAGDNNVVWNYINAKGGQSTSQNQNKAVCLNKAASAELYSETLSGGCSQISFQYEQEYTSAIYAQVFINEQLIAELTLDNQPDITHFFQSGTLNIEGEFQIRIKQKNSSAGQITIDDLQWQPYSINNNDNTSSIEASENQPVDTDITIENNSFETAMNIFNFIITDSASGDNLPTIVRKMKFKRTSESNCNFEDCITGMYFYPEIQILSTTIAEDFLEVEVEENSLTIADGSSTEIEMFCWFTAENLEDNTNFQIEILSENSGFAAYSTGSGFCEIFANNIISTFFNAEIVASSVLLYIDNQSIEINSLFHLNLLATNIYGKVDTDENGQTNLALHEGSGLLEAETGLTKNFSAGGCSWNDLTYNQIDTIIISATHNNLGVFYSPEITVGGNYNSTVVAPDQQCEIISIPSISDTSGEAVEFFRLKIVDSGGDNAPTIVSRVCLKNALPANTALLTTQVQSVEIWDNQNLIITQSPQISENQIYIQLLPNSLIIADGSEKEISFKIYLKNSAIIEGKQFAFFIDAENHGWESNNAGSGFANFFAENIYSPVFFINVVANQLIINSQPSQVSVNQPFVFSVKCCDENQNLDTDYPEIIEFSLASGDGNLTSAGSLSGFAEEGVFYRNDLIYNNIGYFSILIESQTVETVQSSAIFAAGNNNSTILNPENQIVATAISSLCTSNAQAVDVFKFVISDSGNGDNSPTILQKLKIQNNFPANSADWKNSIGGFVLKQNNNSIQFDEIIINSNYIEIQFVSNPPIINDGATDEFVLALFLKENALADNSTFQFKISEINHGCTTYQNGSGFADNFIYPIVSQIFTTEIVATKLSFLACPTFIQLNENFEVKIASTDVFGSIDTDFSNTVSLQPIGSGQLTSETGLQIALNSGYFCWNDLQYNTLENFQLELTAENFDAQTSSLIACVSTIKDFVFEDFENTELENWINTEHWISSSFQPISGEKSLKHNLENIAGNSNILLPLLDFQPNTGTMNWQFQMKNGNWNPTSSNSFGIVLYANENIVQNSNFDAYIFGVNLQGADNKPTLWRVLNGDYQQVIKCPFEWHEEETYSFDIFRTAIGNWQINYVAGNEFIQLQNTDTVCDTTVINAQYCGAIFNYTTTRAGKFWFDNFIIRGINTPPTAENIVANSDFLLIYFNENLNLNQTFNFSDFTITSDNIEYEILNIEILAENNKILKVSTQSLNSGFYSIEFQNVEDAEELPAILQILNFEYYKTPAANELIINEIMADPSPVVGLPAFEFIEIYNNTNDEISTQNCVLISNSTQKTLPASLMPPHSFLILCDDEAESFFIEYGNVGVLATFPTLTNSGQYLALKNKNDEIISEINYNLNWYHDPQKEEGGWTLERIDPTRTCGQANNWAAAVAESGGTPGTENSVFANNPDLLPPNIQLVTTENQQSVFIQFNETIAWNDAVANNIYVAENFTDSIIINSTTNSCLLYLQDILMQDVEYQVVINGIADECGNVIENFTTTFIYHIPQYNDLIINEIMTDPSPSAGLPESDYLELYNRSGFAVSLKDWTITIGTSVRTFPAIEIAANGYLIVTQQGSLSQFLPFGNCTDILSSSDLTNSGKTIILKNATGEPITEISYSSTWYHDPEKEDGGWSLERIDNERTCGDFYNWTASISSFGGTPATQNSVFASNPDNEVIEIERINAISENILLIYLSEIPEQISSLALDNYILDNELFPDSVFIDNQLNSIKLYFSENFVQAKDYSLNINTLIDLCGNAQNNINLEFTYYSVQYNDLIITEIMADENPAVGLPEYEYFELFNRSQYAIDLAGWAFSVGTTVRYFTDFILAPNTYCIICSNEAAELFSEYGNVLSISSFPALPNTGKTITVFDILGREICSQTYSADWYGDSEKSAGGWSLERIDNNNLCSTAGNWKASQNEQGGTPCTENSIIANNLDNSAPEILYHTVIQPNIIEISFNEILNSELSTQPENFSLINSFNISYIPDSVKAYYTINYAVQLYFPIEFSSGSSYTLQISNFEDECGNISPATEILFTHYIATYGDLLITEILADESPALQLPEYEFIELYNNSEFSINLLNYSICVGSSERFLPAKILQPAEYLILCKNEAVPFYSTFGKTLDIQSFPSITNSASEILLKNSVGKIIHTVKYSENMFSSSYKKEGGWSVERIGFENLCFEELNWEESVNQNGGTPGAANTGHTDISIDLETKLIRAGIVENNLIRIYFNAKIDNQTLNNQSFIIEPTINIQQIALEEPFNTSVLIEFAENVAVNKMYEILPHESLRDLCGNNFSNQSVKFALPTIAEPNDLIINEILFNPYAGANDFIEIYNKSQKTIDLKNYFIANAVDGQLNEIKAISENSYLLFPEQYLVITKNAQQLESLYYIAENELIIEGIDLPSFPDDAGTAILCTAGGTLVIDQFSYTDDMHYALLRTTDGVSLERINFLRPSHELANWHSAAQTVGFATPTYKNSVFSGELPESQTEFKIEPEIFCPDNDGYNDVVNIHFSLKEEGYVANIDIYDPAGQLVKRLVNNELLAKSGTISWNGVSGDGKKARVGIYLIYIEIFNLTGDVKSYKEICVLANK